MSPKILNVCRPSTVTDDQNVNIRSVFSHQPLINFAQSNRGKKAYPQKFKNKTKISPAKVGRVIIPDPFTPSIHFFAIIFLVKAITYQLLEIKIMHSSILLFQWVTNGPYFNFGTFGFEQFFELKAYMILSRLPFPRKAYNRRLHVL